MRFCRLSVPERFTRAAKISAFVIALAAALTIVQCGSNSSSQLSSSGMGTMGTVQVSMSDPPTCAARAGSLDSVFITVRSVQAHTSGTATDQSAGWQELAPQLNTQPIQLDLLHLPLNGSCLLAQLGSGPIPVGDYQQIRLLLVANGTTTGPLPVSNACGGSIFNCVVVTGQTSPVPLDLSSQAKTGLKIPPGQIAGGPIRVAAGQAVDINLDFNACASVIREGNGQFRLKPTLTASQVSVNSTGIDGQVLDSVSHQPIAGAMVALEFPDAKRIDRIFMQSLTDSNGHFSFCPLPTGQVFDVVVDAVASGVAYNATVVQNVPDGTALGSIPIVAETGALKGPATIEGFVTTLNGSAGANVDATVSAFQDIVLSGGAMRQVTIPLFAGSTSALAVSTSTNCPSGSPMNAFCADYTLFVPASNPYIGAFSAGVLIFNPNTPAPPPIPYSVEVQTSSAGAMICSPSSQSTSMNNSGQALTVAAGSRVDAQRLDFFGCM